MPADTRGRQDSASLDPLTEDPADAARQLIRSTDTKHPPVELGACLKHPLFEGLELHDEDSLVKDGYLLEFGDGTGRVLLDRDAPETRQRYTLAHELAHWLVHRYADVRSSSGEDRPARPDEEPWEEERWCEAFAAELLMPAPWLRRHVGRFEALGEPRVLHGGPDRFHVSQTAFYHRLTELYDVVVLHRRVTDSGTLTRTYPAYERGEATTDRLRAYVLDEWGPEVWYGETGRAAAGPRKIPWEGGDHRYVVFAFEGRHRPATSG